MLGFFLLVSFVVFIIALPPLKYFIIIIIIFFGKLQKFCYCEWFCSWGFPFKNGRLQFYRFISCGVGEREGGLISGTHASSRPIRVWQNFV